jgi:hypothetical protein
MYEVSDFFCDGSFDHLTRCMYVNKYDNKYVFMNVKMYVNKYNNKYNVYIIYTLNNVYVY